jgi:hypothetical protein
MTAKTGAVIAKACDHRVTGSKAHLSKSWSHLLAKRPTSDSLSQL